MGDYETVHIEFERLGEAEVSRLIVAHAFDEPTRANAMRWLNDRAMARTTKVERGRGRALQDWEIQLNDARHAARAASAVSVLALVVAVAATALAIEALRSAHVDVRRAETLAEAVAESSAPSAASTAATARAPPKPHHHALAP